MTQAKTDPSEATSGASGAPSPLSRVNAFAGMMIDADAWRDAHEYHREAARLHHTALHGWGIVRGLDVLLGASDNALLIQPGIAVDPAGNFIIVPDEQVHRIETRDKGTVYLVLQFRDVPGARTAGAGHPTRIVERFSIQERGWFAADACVELVRFELDPKGGPIKHPRAANEPGPNELDTRHRLRLASNQAPLLYAAVPGRSGPSAEPDRRVDGLAQRVITLAARLDLLALDVDSLVSGAPPAPRLSDVGTPSAERHAGVSTEEFDAATERVEGLALQVETIARRTETHSPRIVQLTERVESLSRDLDLVAGQVESLSTRPLPPAVVTNPPYAPGPAPALRLALGAHGAQGWDSHLLGLRYLAREVKAASGIAAQALEPVSMSDMRGIDVLYVCGYAVLSVTEADLAGLGVVLEQGGVIVGEGCAAGPSGEAGAREFAFSFAELASRLGRRLSKIERGHPLLVARHIFADPPPGGRTSARVMEAGGMVYSDADYGCAWQGGAAQRPLARSAIKDAFDFGLNLVLFRRSEALDLI